MFAFIQRSNSKRSWRGWSAASSLGRRRKLLLTQRQFEREVASERLRSARRGIPFCILTIGNEGNHTDGNARKWQPKRIISLLHRNLRTTDEKGFLSANRYGVLLVDTPEMGGRAVLDRLNGLFAEAKIDVTLSLQVHDPEGFGDDGPDDNSSNGDAGNRRADDSDDANWVRRPKSGIDAPVSASQAALNQPRVHQSHLSVVNDELPSPRPMLSRWIKRSMDIAGASFGLCVSSPFLVGAMVAVKLSDRGPAFFCQTREGQYGRPFTIYKLRTMVVDAEKSQAELRAASHRDGPAFKISHDPRVTRVGQFLRSTCLDELPQLINVLKGDMSLVGPRPLPWHESRACERWHRRRLDVRPGLTCIWQVDKAKAETFDDWMRMDLRYIDRLGVFQDLQLIARTVMVPITGRGSE